MKDLTKTLRDPKDIGATFATFIDQVAEVPFGNSDYQNRHTIVNDERTPMRAYRHAALRITNRLNALIEAYYHLRRTDVEIRQMERRLKTEPDDLECELLALDIEQKRALLPYTQKLVNDAIREIETLYPVIEKLGKVKREQFEIEEGEHFALKLNAPAGPEGNGLYENITGIPPTVRALTDAQS